MRILERLKSRLSRTLASRKFFEKLFPNSILSLQPAQRQFSFVFLFSFVFSERSHEQLLRSPDVQSLVTEYETDAAAMAYTNAASLVPESIEWSVRKSIYPQPISTHYHSKACFH